MTISAPFLCDIVWNSTSVVLVEEGGAVLVVEAVVFANTLCRSDLGAAGAESVLRDFVISLFEDIVDRYYEYTNKCKLKLNYKITHIFTTILL